MAFPEKDTLNRIKEFIYNSNIYEQLNLNEAMVVFCDGYHVIITKRDGEPPLLVRFFEPSRVKHWQLNTDNLNILNDPNLHASCQQLLDDVTDDCNNGLYDIEDLVTFHHPSRKAMLFIYTEKYDDSQPRQVILRRIGGNYQYNLDKDEI